jgi:quinoprotein glucose dehydrogenase
MRRVSLLTMIAAFGFVVVSADGRTVWDGVYTDAQAKRGEKVYADKCVSCHTDSLLGDGTATALTGTGFAANWDGVSLAELVERTRNTMPDDDPGTLSRQQVADVIAFVLKFNKFPTGGAELAPQAEALNQIKFVATKPDGTGR